MDFDLEGCLFFKDMTKEEIEDIIQKIDYQVDVYQNRQNINDKRNYRSEIGIIISGRVDVIKSNASGKKIILNTLNEKDVFGISTLFNREFNYPTEIVTKKKCKVMFIEGNELLKLFNINQKILINYIAYVNSRILFLNNKIESFIGDNVRSKIEYFLQNEALVQNNQEFVQIKYSKKELADYLCISRPSLYRVLKDMEKEGLLALEKDRIILLQSNNEYTK